MIFIQKVRRLYLIESLTFCDGLGQENQTQYCKDVPWKTAETCLRMYYGSNENMPYSSNGEVIFDLVLLDLIGEEAAKSAILRMGIGRVNASELESTISY